MVRRVSLKGKGADIFFGADVPADAATSPIEKVSETDASPSDAAQAAKPMQRPAKEGQRRASMQESMHARKHASLPDDEPEVTPIGPELIARIAPLLSERATITNAFRYTDRELSSLTDAIYEVTKRHGIKLSKQDIARLGLNFVLWDYRTRGDDSLLGVLALRRKAQQSTEG